MRSRPMHHITTFCFGLASLGLLFYFLTVNCQAAPAANPPSASLAAFQAIGKLAPEVLEELAPTGRTEVILVIQSADIRERLREKLESRGLSLPDQALRTEKSRLYQLRKRRILDHPAQAEWRVLSRFDHLPVLHLEVNEQALAALLGQDEVAAIDPNRALEPHLLQSLLLIKADQAQSAGATGLGTSVAVLDTGVDYTHAAFGSCTAPGTPATCKVAYVQDFATEDHSLDDNGHGTNVSGVVAGVAPDARIIGLDVFEANGLAYYDDLLAALNWVLANQTVYNIVAVNMSLGGSSSTVECPNDSLAVTITDLKDAGITSAVSSGNDGFLDALGIPACAPNALSVGAVYDSDIGPHYSSVCSDSSTAADQVACYSNSASFLDLLAPGAWTTAAGLTYSGTSQAAPHAAGGVAILKEAQPLLTVDEAVALLTSAGGSVTDHRNGLAKPRLDLYAALNSSSPIIGFSPASLEFQVTQDGALPPGQFLTIRNDGALGFSWTVSSPAAWLALSPASGSEDGTISASLTTSSLAVGTYNTEIVIDSPTASNSPLSVVVTLTVSDPARTEGFESGDFAALPWNTGGDAPWQVQDATVYAGSFAARSGLIGDSQSTFLEVLLNVTEPGFITFWLKTSTEPQWDQLKFRVDGVNAGKWDGWHGENDWLQATSDFEIQPGFHTFTWEYEKDLAGIGGSDAVWLDEIVFPAFDLEIPEIDLGPASHDFGAAAVNTTSAPWIFTVTNLGGGQLDISSVSLAGTAPDQFAITANGCTGQSLTGGTSCLVEVVFAPTAEGAFSAELAVASNDPVTPTAIASLSGTALISYFLSVTTDGTGSGTATSSPAGIDCGTDCSETYLDGTSVTLTASPASDSSFGGWSGGGCSGTGDCTVAITADTAVTATFEILPPVADFSAEPITGAAPLIVDFTDLSANSPTAWAWDFGDAETGYSQHPAHIYRYEGTYSPTLIVTNGSGSDTLTRTDYLAASACPNLAVKIGPDYYPGLQAAYNDATTGEIIEAQALAFSEDLFLDLDLDLTLAGGNNCEYTRSGMGTVIQGSLTISHGSVVVEKVIIE